MPKIPITHRKTVKLFIKEYTVSQPSYSYEEIFQLTQDILFLNLKRKFLETVILKYLNKYLKLNIVDITSLNQFHKKIQKMKDDFNKIFYIIDTKRIINLFLNEIVSKTITKNQQQLKDDLRDKLATNRLDNEIETFVNVINSHELFNIFFNDIKSCLVEIYLTEIELDLDQINDFLDRERNVNYLKDCFYEIEKEYLTLALKNLVISFSVYLDRKRFYNLFNLYFTAQMQSDFYVLVDNFINYMIKPDQIIYNIYFLYSFSFWIDEVIDNEDVKRYVNTSIGHFINKHKTLISKQLNHLFDKQIREKCDLMNLTSVDKNYILEIFEKQCSSILYNTQTFEYVLVTVDIILFCINFLENKIYFENEYAYNLANRLLTMRYDLKYESEILGHLKIQSLNIFYKSKMMIKDFANSNDILFINNYRWFNYENYPIDNDDLTQFENDIKEKLGTEFQYEFNHCIGLCEIEIDEKQVILTILQFYILKQLVECDISLEDLKNKINYKYVDNHLNPLIKNEIVLLHDDILKFNKIKENINVCPEFFEIRAAEKDLIEGNEQDIENNDYILDAYIVKIMKRNKSYTIKKIIAEIKKEFKFKNDIIIARIQNLATREFLEINDNDVTYIP